MPAYELLGGRVRDRIKVYSWIGGDRPPSDTAKAAREVVDRGFTAVKMNGTEELQYLDSWDKVDQCLANVAAVRDAVGPNIGIGVDFHGRVHKPMAKVLLKELEPFRLMFVEEPVLSEHVDGFVDVLRQSPIPIALGERLFSRWDFKTVLASGGAVDIIQPDPSHCGGITEARKIAHMAEAYDVHSRCTAPSADRSGHVPADRRGLLQRDDPGTEPRHPLQHVERSPRLSRRPVRVHVRGRSGPNPHRSGTGHRGERGVRDRTGRRRHRWRNPVWRHTDGSFAEW